MERITRLPRPEGPQAIPNIIREELNGRKDTVVVGEIIREVIVPGPYAAENVLFFVAPKESISDVEKLNQFMNGLISRVRPNHEEKAMHRRRMISVGHLHFSEGGFVRETDLFVYPNQSLAEVAYKRRQEIEDTPLRATDLTERMIEYHELVRETMDVRI